MKVHTSLQIIHILKEKKRTILKAKKFDNLDEMDIVIT